MNQVTPENMLQIILNPEVRIDLNGHDNEMITQIIMSLVHQLIKTSVVSDYEILFSNLERYSNTLGFKIDYSKIDRTQIKDYVYYSKMTRNGMYRSPYHPLYLMTLIPEDERENIPDSYTALLHDIEKLPEIVNIIDNNTTEVYKLTFKSLSVANTDT
jgi:hypothetical protein